MSDSLLAEVSAAAEMLAKTAAAGAVRRQLYKAAGRTVPMRKAADLRQLAESFTPYLQQAGSKALDLGQQALNSQPAQAVGSWAKANPELAATLGGAAGGALVGGATSLAKPRERRQTGGSMLTGALAGGLAGFGGALAYPQLRQLLSQQTTPADKTREVMQKVEGLAEPNPIYTGINETAKAVTSPIRSHPLLAALFGGAAAADAGGQLGGALSTETEFKVPRLIGGLEAPGGVPEAARAMVKENPLKFLAAARANRAVQVGGTTIDPDTIKRMLGTATPGVSPVDQLRSVLASLGKKTNPLGATFPKAVTDALGGVQSDSELANIIRQGQAGASTTLGATNVTPEQILTSVRAGRPQGSMKFFPEGLFGLSPGYDTKLPLGPEPRGGAAALNLGQIEMTPKSGPLNALRRFMAQREVPLPSGRSRLLGYGAGALGLGGLGYYNQLRQEDLARQQELLQQLKSLGMQPGS